MTEYTHYLQSIEVPYLTYSSSNSAFFFASLLWCGAPFSGSFFDPASFSYSPPSASYSLASFEACSYSKMLEARFVWLGALLATWVVGRIKAYLPCCPLSLAATVLVRLLLNLYSQYVSNSTTIEEGSKGKVSGSTDLLSAAHATLDR